LGEAALDIPMAGQRATPVGIDALGATLPQSLALPVPEIHPAKSSCGWSGAASSARACRAASTAWR
jgi:hypothetical protein